MHTVNGDGSKTAKIIKGNVNHTNIDIQAMFVWLTLPFMIFAVFDPSPLTVCINCSFLHLSGLMPMIFANATRRIDLLIWQACAHLRPVGIVIINGPRGQ